MNAAELAVALAEQLEQDGIPYAVGGAIAYGFWGNPRGTRDVDLNVFIPAEDAGRVIDTLMSWGVRFDREPAIASARERGDARGYYDDLPVDLFFVSIPLHESAAKRRRQVQLLEREISILSPEDLVVFKLLFFRGKDVVDVERVVAIQGEGLDREYVRRWLIDCVGEDDERVQRWDAISAALPAR
jgi:hypothetical protein